jgi:hypothetical protein
MILELMLDCGRVEESRFHWIILRNLRGKVEDVFFRSLQLFYSPGIPETVNHKRKKGNPKLSDMAKLNPGHMNSGYRSRHM